MGVFALLIVLSDPISGLFWEWNDDGTDEVYVGFESK